MKAKAKAQGKGKVGRPCLGEEVMRPHTIRTTQAQYDKLQQLGGGAWIRRKIDAAKI